MFSADLQDKLKALTVAQRRAVVMIASAEMDGVPVSWLLKNSYSCQWCGRTIGRSGDDSPARKALLTAHETDCDRLGSAWLFAANESTYYSDWLKQEAFVDVLNEAREQVIDHALEAACREMKVSTVQAVREARRQISEGEKDIDRLRAAFGILDRASSLTARKGKLEIEHQEKQKQNGKVMGLLERLRGAA